MANKRIQGITIEIGGDTTKLTSALSAVDKSLAETQRSLKDVNKLLKLDPGNVDLLKQKQGYLTQAISDTESKLKTEKEALKQLKESDTSGTVSEKQKALEREIAATEKSLEGLKAEYKEFGSVASQQLKVAGEKIKGMGDKVTEVGKGLTKNVTAPIAAVGAGAVASWKEVDEALDIVTKKTGASGQALEDMQTTAKSIATTIPTSFETAASAVGEVNTRFGVTGKELETLSTKFIKFADLNDKDVSDSIDSVQKAMAAMNVDLDDADDFLDSLNTAAQQSGIDVDTLTSSIIANAAAFEDMGFSVGDTVEFLAGVETSGVEVNTVMTGLKKALAAAAKEGKPTSEALKDVQKSIKGAKTDTDATRIAIDLFGTKAGPAIAKAVREGKLSFESFGKDLDSYAGSVEDTFEATKDPLDDVTVAMNQMKELGADIVETSAPMITKVMETLRDVIKDLSDKWNSLDDDQKQMIIKAALIVAALGPVVTVIGTIVGGVGSLVSGIGSIIGLISGAGGAVAAAGSATAAVGGVTAAVGAGGAAAAGGGGLIAALGSLAAAAAPFLIAGAVIVGIVAATALIIKNWDKIKEAAKKLGEAVKKKWEELKKKTAEVWDNIKTKTAEIWDNVKNKVSTTVDNVKTTVKTKFEDAKTAASNAFTNLKTSVSTAIDNAKTAIATKAGDIATTVKTKFGTARDNAKSAIDTLKTQVSEKFDAVKTKISTVSGDIATKVKDKFDAAKKSAEDAAEKLRFQVVTKFDAVEGAARDIASTLDNTFGTDITGAIDKAEYYINDFKDTVSTVLTSVKNKAANFTWKIPKPSLPHIKMKWTETEILGKKFKYPSGFETSWYRKAYENAIMFTRPTVLQTPYGNKGFGDGPGGEIVLSDAKLRQIAGSGDTTYNINIYGAKGQDVNALADAVQARLAMLQRQRGAAGLT